MLRLLLLGLFFISPLMQAKEIKHEFQSKVANQSLLTRVLLPENYDPKLAYPVIYTTAAGRRLALLRKNVDWLSHVSMGPVPSLIIVTIPDVKVKTDMHPKYLGASGVTNEKTLAVLQQELIPLIEKSYKTWSFRIVEGYSSYGNFPLYVLLHGGALFNAFISVSPALALDKTGLLDKLKQGKPKLSYKGKFLYISRSNFSENVVPMQAVHKALNLSHYPDLQWQYQDLSTDNFLMPALTSPALALQELFSDLHIRDFSPFVKGGASAIRQYFRELGRKYGYELDAQQAVLDFAFYLSEEQLHQQATEVAKSLADAQPTNIFLKTRYAEILTAAKATDKALSVLVEAQELASMNNNQDALDYIRQRIAEIKG